MKKQEPKVYDVTIGIITDFGNDTRNFNLVFDAGTTIEFDAGQFVAVLYPTNGKIIRRAYSIASAPEQKDRLDLVVKLVQGGAVTNWFWSLTSGDRFQVHGPLGKFVLPDPIEFDIVFVATGTGIAPFRSMIHHLLPLGFQGKVWLIFGVRYQNAIPYEAEWIELSKKYSNFMYVPTLSRPTPEWKGETGYVQTKIEKFVGDPKKERVYICGLNEMIQQVQETCLQLGFTKEQIFFERYD